jgi:hypothetical protein
MAVTYACKPVWIQGELWDSERVRQNFMHAGDEANYSSKGGRT